MLVSAGVLAVVGRKLFGWRTRRVFPSFFAMLWALIYFFRVVETPEVMYRRTHFNTVLLEKAKLTSKTFWPVFWAFNRHAQTVTCYVVSAFEWLWATPVLFKRETISGHDGNEQYLDWAYFGEKRTKLAGTRAEKVGSGIDLETGTEQRGDEMEEDTDDDRRTWQTPIIVCVHGLGDTREIPYLKRFARMALQKGWHVVVWSYWSFLFEESRDLKLVIDHLHNSYPRAPLVAVAWSAGGYILTRYLQKAGQDTPLVCAIAQSPCLDFVQAVKNVTENENQTYPLFLLGQARTCLKRHIRTDKRITDKKVFDDLFYELDSMELYNKFCTLAPEPLPDTTGFGPAGFITSEGTLQERIQNAAHYSQVAIDHMDSIKTTMLLLHSDDDPVVSSAHVNWTKLKANKHVIVAHTHRGGHCAWHEGVMPFGDTWGDRVTCDFISAVLETHSQTHFVVEIVRQAMKTSIGGGSIRRNSRDGDLGAFTPQRITRITSASDLASMGNAPFTVAKRGSFTRLNELAN